MLPERTIDLSPSWLRISIPLAGARYSRIIGAFAWLLRDTAQPARFYLDDIVWE